MNSDGATRRAGWVLPLVLVLAVACVFGRSLGHPFVIWDDPWNVSNNPAFDPPTLRSLAGFWTQPYEHLYVPVAYSIWWWIALVSRALFGQLEPGFFHGANLLLHAGCVLLVFRLLCELLEDRRAAFAGALVFALHPLQVESVSWISELRGLAAASLGFGALLCELRGRRRTALLLFALALLAKPTALVFLALPILIEVGWRGRSWREVLLGLWPWILLAAGAAVVTLVAQADVAPTSHTALSDRPLVALDALGFYVEKLAWPAQLCADYGRKPQLVLGSPIPWFACLALLLACAAVILVRERRRAWLALAWFAVALLPVLGFVPFAYQSQSTVADRYAYVALAGAALYVGLLVRSYGTPARVIVLGLALCCGLASFTQAATWRDTQTLFGRVLEFNPGSFPAHHNLAADAVLRRDFAFAREHFQRALELDPTSYSALSNLAVCECELGQLDEGIEHLRQSIARRPGLADMRTNLVSALANQGRMDEAEREARALAALEPVDVRNLLPLARVLRVRGQRAQAAELLERVLAALPDWEPALVERAALGPP